MALTYHESRTAKIVGIVMGLIIGIGFGVVAPMSANYRCHGSVFLLPGDPNDEHAALNPDQVQHD